MKNTKIRKTRACETAGGDYEALSFWGKQNTVSDKESGTIRTGRQAGQGTTEYRKPEPPKPEWLR